MEERIKILENQIVDINSKLKTTNQMCTFLYSLKLSDEQLIYEIIKHLRKNDGEIFNIFLSNQEECINTFKQFECILKTIKESKIININSLSITLKNDSIIKFTTKD